MADEPPSPFSIFTQKTDLIDSITTKHFSQRLATFITHVTNTQHEPLPTPFIQQSNPKPHFNFNFKPWKPPPIKWAEWVNQMAGKHSAIWLQSGIFDSIMNSIYEIPCNRAFVSSLSQFWSPKTNTFVFPWGEATVTLEDVMILGGYSVTGDYVDNNCVDISVTDLWGKAEMMNKFRLEMPFYYQDYDQILCDSLNLDDDLRSFVSFVTPCEVNGVGCKAKYHPQRVAMQFGFDQDVPGDVCSYKLGEFVKFMVPSRSFRPGVSMRYYDWWMNVDRTDLPNDRDSSYVECRKIEQEDCDKKCGFEVIDLSVEDGFDDILVTFKKICNATKRKIGLLKESYVGVQQSKRKKMGSDVIIID
ncbi:hypothetical protein QVD17_05874 [Tagetes erecta]|uniref:Aminotransferase-like plant mobile domain-containing protein n=1 Tax=Tagetes erecta TaxID=13708 RepID=A0AAD8LFV4_TARER|nr:hypothetical protein QVD17_05874 [Tagetes erecta]